MTVSPTASERSTDDELRRRVWLFVQQRQLTSGARLSIHASRGVVTLRGTAASFHQRQLLYAFACRVAGVVHVIDELHVAGPPLAAPQPRSQPLLAAGAA